MSCSSGTSSSRASTSCSNGTYFTDENEKNEGDSVMPLYCYCQKLVDDSCDMVCCYNAACVAMNGFIFLVFNSNLFLLVNIGIAQCRKLS